MSRTNRKGRSADGGRFVQLHHFMLNSPAWRCLSAQDRAAYVAVAMTYNGANNGYLAVSVRQIAEHANINKDTAAKCLGRLQKLGFLELVTPGAFSRKVRHAAEWRLTFYKCDRTHALPSKAFLKWRPENAEHRPSLSDSPSPALGHPDPEIVPSAPPIRTSGVK